MTSLENREISGITNRLIVTAIISLVSITAGGTLFYAGLMAKIDKVADMQEVRKTEVNLQLNAINEKVDNIKDDLKDVKSDIKEIRAN